MPSSADADLIPVAVSYRREWADGFGARGWKLDAAAAEADVIASTAYTGGRIPTSVLVHDILDHHLSGFGLSGHREEACALIQLGLRTGSDIRPDYAQMVDEDILQGRVHGEDLETFLPERVRALVPPGGDPRERMAALSAALGRDLLREILIGRFYELGLGGAARAERFWREAGLDYGRRREIGLALQRLLERADARMLEAAVEQAAGAFLVGNARCALALRLPGGVPRRWEEPVRDAG